MDKLAAAIEEEGYVVWNADYDSRSAKVEALAKQAIEPGLNWCAEKQTSAIHFVTHSLGGILVRYFYQKRLLPKSSRIVMLAPPNKGSVVAELLKEYYLYKKITGPAGQQLGKDEESLPASLQPINAEIGVIAGNSSVDPWFSPFIEGDNDGKVMVDDTRLAEMKDFIVVEHSHTFIMKSEEVIGQIIYFLANGSFSEQIIRDNISADDLEGTTDAK